MELIDFLEQLTEQGMGLVGTHPQYALKYELRLTEAFKGRRNALVVTWSDDERSPEYPHYCAYATLDVRRLTTIKDMQRVAVASMSVLIEAEDLRSVG